MATQTSPKVLYSQFEQKLLNRAPQFEILELKLYPERTMLSHINDTYRSVYCYLQIINTIRKYLLDCSADIVIQTLVIRHVEYCNNHTTDYQ